MELSRSLLQEIESLNLMEVNEYLTALPAHGLVGDLEKLDERTFRCAYALHTYESTMEQLEHDFSKETRSTHRSPAAEQRICLQLKELYARTRILRYEIAYSLHKNQPPEKEFSPDFEMNLYRQGWAEVWLPSEEGDEVSTSFDDSALFTQPH